MRLKAMKKILAILLLLLFFITPIHSTFANDVTPTETLKTDRIILKYKHSIDHLRFTAEEMKDGFIDRENKIISIPSSKLNDIEVRNLILSNKVEYVEKDYKREITSLTGAKNNWDVKAIDLNRFGDNLQPKEDVIVAVIDTGLDYTHPEFNGRIVNGYDFIDENNRPIDKSGHGTHVAGIILRTTENIPVKIMPVRVLNVNYGYDSVIAQGIRYAVDNGADVINLSFGAHGFSLTQQEAIHYALEKGVFVVAAAGNDYQQIQNFYPASEKNVFTVGASKSLKERADFSNYGKELDVLAPGNEIYSTFPSKLDMEDSKQDGYTLMDGTSMAAPFVSGIAAAIKSADPTITNDELEILLKKHVLDIGQKGFDIDTGFGHLKMTDFDLQSKAFFINTTFIKQTSQNVEVGTLGYDNGKIELYMDEILLDTIQFKGNGFHSFDLKEVPEGNEVELTAKLFDPSGKEVRTVEQTVSVNNSIVTFEPYDQFGNVASRYNLSIFGVNEFAGSLLYDDFQIDHEGPIEVDLSAFDYYDSYVALLVVDGVYYAQEIERDGYYVLKKDGLPFVEFTNSYFDYGNYGGLDLELNIGLPQINLAFQYKEHKLNSGQLINLLLDNKMYVSSGIYDITFTETGKQKVFVTKENVQIDRSTQLDLAHYADLHKVKINLQNLKLNGFNSSNLFVVFSNPNSFLYYSEYYPLQHNGIFYLGTNEYIMDLYYPSKDGWLMYLGTIDNININRNQTLHLTGNIGLIETDEYYDVDFQVKSNLFLLSGKYAFPNTPLPEKDWINLTPKVSYTENPYKTWTVKFNRTLNEYLLKHHVKMYDERGRKVPIEISLLKDKQSILVKSKVPYYPNRQYHIFFDNGIRTADGYRLNRASKFSFKYVPSE